MNCPGCGMSEMEVERYPGNYGASLEIDVCHHCNGIWFDGRESLQLSPGSTLQLFKSMHQRQQQARPTLLDAKACPRCQDALAETTDQVRTTRFSYFRCQSHGRYITFFQWLREKSLVRAPSPRELEALKAQVKMIHCSNCGAPIALDKETACGHCAAPISVLAAENLEKAVQSLQTKAVDQATFKPEKLAEAMMLKQQLEEQYRKEGMVDSLLYRSGHRGYGGDLVSLGLGILIDALF